MTRKLAARRVAILAAAAVLLPLAAPTASAKTTAVNASAFPLAGNVLFPARNNRIALRCQNATTNHAATITYPSGFTVVLQPGGALWEIGAGPSDDVAGLVPSGALLATGTAGETLACEETY